MAAMQRRLEFEMKVGEYIVRGHRSAQGGITGWQINLQSLRRRKSLLLFVLSRKSTDTPTKLCVDEEKLTAVELLSVRTAIEAWERKR